MSAFIKKKYFLTNKPQTSNGNLFYSLLQDMEYNALKYVTLMITLQFFMFIQIKIRIRVEKQVFYFSCQSIY